VIPRQTPGCLWRYTARMRLTLSEPRWVGTDGDGRADPCAHGRIHLEVGGQLLIQPEDGELTVSAAALHLLRSVTADHTSSEPLAEGCQFAPCCAHSLFVADEARFGFVATGCPTGVEVDVVHEGDRVVVSRRSGEGSHRVHTRTWAQAVVGFAEQVLQFYDASPPKVEAPPDERQAWRMFWQEYRDRLARARDSTGTQPAMNPS